MYDTNVFVGQQEQVKITREQFFITSQHEKLEGYWSEAAFCFETGDFIAVVGCRERDILIFGKENMEKQQWNRMSEKFKEVFASSYHFS